MNNQSAFAIVGGTTAGSSPSCTPTKRNIHSETTMTQVPDDDEATNGDQNDDDQSCTYFGNDVAMTENTNDDDKHGKRLHKKEKDENKENNTQCLDEKEFSNQKVSGFLFQNSEISNQPCEGSSTIKTNEVQMDTLSNPSTFVTPPSLPGTTKSTKNQHLLQSQQHNHFFQFKPVRNRSSSMTFTTTSISASLSTDLHSTISTETSSAYSNISLNYAKPQRSMSLNHSHHYDDVSKLNQSNQSPFPTTPTTMSTSMSTSMSQTSMSSSNPSSLSAATTATRFEHGLLSPFTPLESTRSTCRSEDSYENLLQPINDTFQRNLQESFNGTSSIKARSRGGDGDKYRTKKRKSLNTDGFPDENCLHDHQEHHCDEDGCSVNSFVLRKDDSYYHNIYSINDEQNTTHERCSMCAFNSYFFNNLGRWGIKLGNLILGIEAPTPAFVENMEYKHEVCCDNVAFQNYNNDRDGPTKNQFVSYSSDAYDNGDYDEEIARLNQASKPLTQQYDDCTNDCTNDSHESPLICNDEDAEDREGQLQDDQRGQCCQINTPPMLPDLSQHIQSPIESMSPRILYGQYDCEPDASKTQHPLLCPQTPKRTTSHNTPRQQSKSEINLSWTTVPLLHSPKHHLFDSFSESIASSLASSKCEQSPTSTTSPFIHPLAPAPSISCSQQRCDSDSSKQGSSDKKSSGITSHPNRDSMTTASSASPKHHLLNSTVASMELNVEFEWLEQASKCEQEGDYTSALHFYGLCLNQRCPEEQKEPKKCPDENDPDSTELCDRKRLTSVVSLLHKIGIVQWKIGSYDLSLNALEEALGKARTLCTCNLIQDDNDETCCVEEKECLSEILNSIGRTYVSQGSYDVAMNYHLDSLALLTSIQSSSLYGDVESVAKSSHIDVHDEKSFIEEEELFEKLKYTSSFDNDNEDLHQSPEQEEAMQLSLHPGIARTMICIGTVQHLQGNHNVAMARFRDGYEIQRKIFGPNHVDIGATLNAIGSVYEKNGDHMKAMRCYKKAHRVYKSQLGDDHNDVAVTLNYIGQVYHELKKYNKAMNAFNEALRIMQIFLGEEHRNVATILFNKALVYKTCGKHDMALKILKDTLSSQRKALGACHADVALTLQSLGDVYEQMGNMENAKSRLHKALKIRRIALGENHIHVALILDRLGQLHLQSESERNKATRRFREAIECYRFNDLDESDSRIVRAKQNLQLASTKC